MKKKSRRGDSFLVALFIVLHGRRAIGYGLGFFRFRISLFDFPSLSVGALCFLMNSLCAMFPSSVSFVLREL